MTDARDPRTVRTVTALQAALREVLHREPLDAVSVSALCRLAGVQRTNFYTHFASVPLLLTEMLTDEIDALLGVPDTAGLSVAALAVEFQETLVAAFEQVARDRRLFRIGFESDASAPLRRSLSDMFARRLDVAFEVWAQLGVALDVDVPVARAFAAGGLTASIESWSLSDDHDPVAWANAVRDQMAPWWPRP